jgi:hypothetical protein
LTSLKVVLAGDKRDYWFTRGFFVRGTCSNLRGGFLKTLVELLDVASMGVARPDPRCLSVTPEKRVDSFVRRGQNAPMEPPESLRGISIPGAAGAIAAYLATWPTGRR